MQNASDRRTNQNFRNISLILMELEIIQISTKIIKNVKRISKKISSQSYKNTIKFEFSGIG
jgi:archaellum biogenesis ATPase FlaH